MIYQFNNYQIDTDNYTLHKHSVCIKVEPRVFDLIVYLLKNKSRLVSRDDLFKNVWGGRDVIDATLSNHIKTARSVLGDDGQSQKVIKTIHGRGYQFVAEVKALSGVNDKPASIPYKKYFSYLTVLVILSLLTFILIKNLNGIELKASDNAIEQKSIAVLAFLDLSPEQDQEYFSDGVSEEILNKLTHLPDLKVISRTSSFFYKGKAQTAKEIGDQLNVSHILEGSIRKYQDKVRITVQLIESRTSVHLWSETYDRTLDNILQIQYDIAHAVSEKLKLSIFPKPETFKVNSEAYTAYLRAKYLTQSGILEDLIESELTVKKAIALDPNYAPSWHLLGVIIFRATHNYAIKSISDGDKASRFAVNKAIKLDPDYALSYATLARIENQQRHFVVSEKDIQKALDLDSKNTYILNVAAHLATYSGKPVEALEIHEQVALIDPKYFANYLGIGFTHFILGNYERAYSAYKKFETYNPNTEIEQYHLCIVSLAMGKNKQALRHAKKEKNAFWKLYAMNLALFAVGETAEADVLFKKFIDEGIDTEQGHIARIYAFRGNIDKSFESLFKAFENNDTSLIELLTFPDFRKMHNDARWHKLIKKMKFPDSHWLVKKLP